MNPVSKQDFKHFSKIDILGFATIVFEKKTLLTTKKHEIDMNRLEEIDIYIQELDEYHRGKLDG